MKWGAQSDGSEGLPYEEETDRRRHFDAKRAPCFGGRENPSRTGRQSGFGLAALTTWIGRWRHKAEPTEIEEDPTPEPEPLKNENIRLEKERGPLNEAAALFATDGNQQALPFVPSRRAIHRIAERGGGEGQLRRLPELQRAWCQPGLPICLDEQPSKPAALVSERMQPALHPLRASPNWDSSMNSCAANRWKSVQKP